VSRRSSASFNDDTRRRLRFEREAREVGLPFARRIARSPRRLIYTVPIVVPVYDEPRTLRITLPALAVPGVRPLVLIDGPDCRRHRFHDGGLCMWWYKDQDEQRWIPDDGLYSLVCHAIDHAYCEARCRRGQPWPKTEAPRAHPTDCPSCRSRR
jgi:hypothetical protein